MGSQNSIYNIYSYASRNGNNAICNRACTTIQPDNGISTDWGCCFDVLMMSLRCCRRQQMSETNTVMWNHPEKQNNCV